eukprot:6209322-Pleurochrysis_carterae.AAC.1
MARRHHLATAMVLATTAAANAARNVTVAAYLPEWRYAGANYADMCSVITHLIFFSLEVNESCKHVFCDNFLALPQLAGESSSLRDVIQLSENFLAGSCFLASLYESGLASTGSLVPWIGCHLQTSGNKPGPTASMRLTARSSTPLCCGAEHGYISTVGPQEAEPIADYGYSMTIDGNE